MIKMRAIYIGDVMFNECNVFELNEETNYFEMLNDKKFEYKKEIVEEDDNWLIFEVIIGKDKLDSTAKLINR
ncbi:hypothetical protein [Tepidibacter aestuarii]|uniref:hypothetical protein n=1 Tax=Tepidibacter aestuarii TaxID=2925782 RepID=UPI0020BE8135|nr:hypothetical protein [Tepidibacter aestuarii]CAH2213186.1 conserved protein of unknown function [Tepidibacter aestuarii]